MPKYVVSTTLRDPEWAHTTVLGGVEDVRALKEDGEGTILVAGSATLVQALHRAGLVDQWNLMVFPVVLGSGKRLFPTDAEDKQKLALTESRAYTNGVQLQVFRATLERRAGHHVAVDVAHLEPLAPGRAGRRS